MNVFETTCQSAGCAAVGRVKSERHDMYLCSHHASNGPCKIPIGVLTYSQMKTLVEKEVAHDIEHLKAQIKQLKKSNEGYLKERNTWARKTADALDDQRSVFGQKLLRIQRIVNDFLLCDYSEVQYLGQMIDEILNEEDATGGFTGNE